MRKAQRKVKVKRVLRDGSHDSHHNFNFLAGEGMEPGIKVGEDSNPRCGGARERVVRAYLRDPPGWREHMGYGQRWMAETFFSGLGRLFGEVVHANEDGKRD